MTSRKRIYCAWLVVVVGGLIADIGTAQEVTRGPYLQMLTPTGTVLRWRTDQTVDGTVRYGLTPSALTETVTGPPATEHEVRLSGLEPDTRYYYTVGTTSDPLAGDSSYTFVTAPSAGFAHSTRIWVIGDSGKANTDARNVRDAYLDFTGTRGTDMWIMLGDNAYSDGTDSEYQEAVFDTYPTLLRQAPVWPTLGNHDGHSASSASQSGPYYDIFSLPTAAEAGGLASGTEAYYSFDRANIHFVVLDSYDTDRSPGGSMLTWLANDLAISQSEWLIAFWHHPPYTKGSHDSDSESALIDMRENALPLLESYGVDLVLSGHSHSYERSYLIDGHYEKSSTFSDAMKIDSGSGREDDTGAYSKDVGGAPNQGAVYAVAGSSGKTSSGPLDHPAMFVSLMELGSMVLDIDGPRLDARFLDDSGNMLDYFTISKGNGAEPPPDTDAPSRPANLRSTNVGTTTITLAWDAAIDNVGVSEYRVTRDGETVGRPGGLSFVDSGLEAGSEYTYSVTALDAAGNESEPASLVVTTAVAADTVAPSAPTGLEVTDVGPSTVTLQWRAASDNVAVTKYRVLRGGLSIALVLATTFSDSGLQAGASYAYAVSALDAAGNESATITLEVTTEAAADPEPNISTAQTDDEGGGGSFDLITFAILAALAAWRFLPRREFRLPKEALASMASAIIVLWSAPAAAHTDLEIQIEDLTELIASRPWDASLYLQRGEIERIHGDWTAAEADFASAQRLGDDDVLVELDLYRASLYRDAGQVSRAIALLDRYIELHPRHVEALRLRALAYADAGEFNAAIADYSRLIDADHGSKVDLRLEQARLLVRSGDPDGALATIDEAITSAGPLVTLVTFGIDTEIGLGRDQAALERFDSLPRTLAGTPEWLWRRGALLDRLGRHEEASEAFAQARAAILDLPAPRRQTLAMLDLLARLDQRSAL